MIRSFVIFGFCLAIYWLNGKHAMATADSWPNAILAFNWLENQTLHLDFLRSSSLFHGLQQPYFLQESPSGHLTSAYPIGTAIVTFPLYACFFVLWKLQAIAQGNPRLDLAADSFFLTRLFYEKLAATILAACTLVIFDRAVRLKFSTQVATLSTIILGFATSMWIIGAQALWQHGSVAFLLTTGLWCLLKANRVAAPERPRYLLGAGLVCGLLPGVRPTSWLLTIALLLYSVYAYRRQVIWLIPGLCSHGLTITWNLYYFGNLQGGYAVIQQALSAQGVPAYAGTAQRLGQGFFGLLLSPSRGLLSFSPILLYAMPGYQRLRSQTHPSSAQPSTEQRDRALLLMLTIAALLLFLSYCAYMMWWAGNGYGPRFLVDILPILVYLLSYQLAHWFDTANRRPGAILLFGMTLLYSIAIQAMGAFGGAWSAWDVIPPMLHPLAHQSRFWDWQDSAVTRGFWRLVNAPQGLLPPRSPEQTRQGKILAVLDATGQPFPPTIIGKSVGPVVVELNGFKLKVQLQNTGTAAWQGYRTTGTAGTVQVRCQLFNNVNQAVQESFLYIPENLPSGGQTTIDGSIMFPDISGQYRLVLDLVDANQAVLPQSQWSNQPHPILVQTQGWRIYQQQIQPLQPLPSIAKANAKLSLPLKLTNQSNFFWRSRGLYPVQLSYRWVRSPQQPIAGFGLRTPLTQPLPIGHSTQVNALVQTPAQPGNYQLRLSMVEEQHAWFDQLGATALTMPIQIQP
jgi:hypothetical protein